MTSTDFIDLIHAKAFHPIRIEGDADKNDFSGDIFIGALDEFFLAAKALGAKTIFLTSSSLDEDDFMYPNESDDAEDQSFEDQGEREGEDDDETETDSDEFGDKVDLTVALPSLSEFKKYLTKEYAFILTAKGGSNELSFYHEEEWWKTFESQREDAIEKVDEDREAIVEKMLKQQAEKDKERIKLVRALIHDSEFVHIPTQRGMKAYATEKYPELEEMDDAIFTEEIQLLSDKIRAKGLNRKR